VPVINTTNVDMYVLVINLTKVVEKTIKLKIDFFGLQLSGHPLTYMDASMLAAASKMTGLDLASR
jgi:hypothetical protein